ncbi:polysaccharide deacetylase family protein [bacterium DOLJORAL78_65_58]|nr:MAG: polysaccharide deacetylase family protein [bacterium DOLZORAL124_64_63]PIE76559.1 MAG: polysaccharide deacetylase family protein [bacterium DOLJORAL78_65_58]
MSIDPRTIMTIDVEEWFHGHNYLEQVPPERWDTLESRVRKGTDLCLEMLAEHGVTATFFTLGWTATRCPEVVRAIVAAGHEVACHSYSHPVVFTMSPEEFRADTLRAREALAAAGVGDVQGYRAPSFSITPPVHHYLDILAECGFRYDCSFFPVRHPRYGQPGSPRRPYRLRDTPESLIEVPMPTWRCLGQNVPFSGGGYLRLLPWPAFRALRAMARRQGIPCIVYLHPWEMDDFKPQVGLSTANSLRSQGGQATMPRKVKRILAEGGPFETMGQYVARLRADAALPVGAA